MLLQLTVSFNDSSPHHLHFLNPLLFLFRPFQVTKKIVLRTLSYCAKKAFLNPVYSQNLICVYILLTKSNKEPENSLYKRILKDNTRYDPRDFIVNNIKPNEQASIIYPDEMPIFDEWWLLKTIFSVSFSTTNSCILTLNTASTSRPSIICTVSTVEPSSADNCS